MEIGKYYEMTRCTGKVIKFKLLDFDLEKRRIETEELNYGGKLNLDCLTDEELISVKEFIPEQPIE